MLLQKLLPLESKLTSKSCLVLVLFLRSLTLPLDADELKLFKVAHQNCVPVSTLDNRVKEREDAHQVALQRERDKLSRLKLELEQLRKEKTATETALLRRKDSESKPRSVPTRWSSDWKSSRQSPSSGERCLNGSTPRCPVSFFYSLFLLSYHGHGEIHIGPSLTLP